MSETYKFTKFTRNVDNANDPITATDSNQVKESINNAEKEIVAVRSEDFVNSAMFTFDHNLFANSLFMDVMDSMEFLNMQKSEGIEYDVNEKAVRLKAGHNDGFIITTRQTGENETLIDDFILLSDTIEPQGSDVSFYLSTNGINFYPIKPDNNKDPLHLGAKAGTQFVLKIALRRNAQNESPLLQSYGVMFYDEMLEKSYGMVNPDLRRFTEVETAGVTLVRDRAQEDRLVKIIEDGSITELVYDYENEGRLQDVVTNDGVNVQKTSLLFGEYLNSNDQIESVLLSIKTAPVQTEDIIPEDMVFDDSEEEGSDE